MKSEISYSGFFEAKKRMHQFAAGKQRVLREDAEDYDRSSADHHRRQKTTHANCMRYMKKFISTSDRTHTEHLKPLLKGLSNQQTAHDLHHLAHHAARSGSAEAERLSRLANKASEVAHRAP